MAEIPHRELLEALDETPSTVTGLSRRLGWDEEEIEEALGEAEDAGLAIFWGELWATTWRAKLALTPRFFRTWIPLSLASGAALTALVVAISGPATTPGWVVLALAGLSGVSILAAVPALVDR